MGKFMFITHPHVCTIIIAYAYRRKSKYSKKWMQVGEMITPNESLKSLNFFGAFLALSDDGKVMKCLI